jgi:hypothetical protein
VLSSARELLLEGNTGILEVVVLADGSVVVGIISVVVVTISVVSGDASVCGIGCAVVVDWGTVVVVPTVVVDCAVVATDDSAGSDVSGTGTLEVDEGRRVEEVATVVVAATLTP